MAGRKGQKFMKLRNKVTGEIVDLDSGALWSEYGLIQIRQFADSCDTDRYESLKDFVEEWEDYEDE